MLFDEHMKKLLILFLLTPMIAFSEQIHLDCKYFTGFDSLGNVGVDMDKDIKHQMDKYGNKYEDSGFDQRIMIDTKKMTLTYANEEIPCEISKDGNAYDCSGTSYSNDPKHGGEYYSRHQVDRITFKDRYETSRSNKLNGEKDFFQYSYGQCERLQDIQ